MPISPESRTLLSQHALARETLARRLDRLEREHRRWKRVGSLFLVALAAVVLMGQASPAGRVVEAERFVLRDGSGKVRATLATLDDNRVALFLYDQDERPRAGLGLRADGGVGLTLYDRAGRPRTALSPLADGGVGLHLYDQRGERRAGLALKPDGTPSLEFLDEDGKSLWRAP